MSPGFRLPIQHQSYQYPPSHHPYFNKLKEQEGLVFVDSETEKHRGHWRSLFPSASALDQRPLHVEIGCNAGHVIVEWAQAHPENLYLGIDWKFKSIFRAAEKAKKRNLKNIVFLRAYAERLSSIFGENELDSLCLFFPDPWAKNSQVKNRFFSPERLKQIALVMKPTGLFHVKTDHREYFKSMLKITAEASAQWNLLEMSMNLHEHHPDPQKLQIPEVTLFEKIFIRENLPIHSMKLRPKNSS